MSYVASTLPGPPSKIRLRVETRLLQISFIHKALRRACVPRGRLMSREVKSNPTDEVIQGPKASSFNLANDERQKLSSSSISFSDSKSAMCREEEKAISIFPRRQGCPRRGRFTTKVMKQSRPRKPPPRLFSLLRPQLPECAINLCEAEVYYHILLTGRSK